MATSQYTDVISYVQSDLEKLKYTVSTALEGEDNKQAILRTVESMIEKTQHGLDNRILEISSHVNNRCLVLPQMNIYDSKDKKNEKKNNVVQFKNQVTNKIKDGRSPGQQFKDLQKIKSILNPCHPHTRQILEQEYSLNTKKDNENDIFSYTHVSLSKLNQKKTPLKSKITKLKSTETSDNCLLELVERKIIPTSTVITLDPSPVAHKQLTLYPHKQVLPVTIKPKEKLQDAIHTPKNTNSEIVLLERNSSDIILIPPLPTPSLDFAKEIQQIIIQHGKTQMHLEEFDNYKQHHCLEWGNITQVLSKLEQILYQYSVPVAFINGEKLLELSRLNELRGKITIEQMLNCFINISDVKTIMSLPGRRFLASDGQYIAALVIQARYRGYTERKKYLEYRRKRWASAMIALVWVMHCKVSIIKKQLADTRLRQIERYNYLTKKLESSWKDISTSNHVVIHLPSLGYDQSIRDNIQCLSTYQNLQFGRCSSLANSSSIIIYISPVKLTKDLEIYYKNLLCLHNNEETLETISKRCIFITPEYIDRFPFHNLPLSTILKYSTQTLQRIKHIIAARNCYIIPGVLNDDDLHISELLKAPILGPTPKTSRLYSTKSGARHIFKSAGCNYAIGVGDLFSMKQIYNSLAKLIACNLEIKTWIFKINDEINGKGTAICDILLYLKCSDFIFKQVEKYGSEWNQAWAQEASITKITQEIPGILNNELHLCKFNSYETIENYFLEFTKRGGIIEAYPSTESITSLTANIFINPLKEIEVMSILDQIHGQNDFHCWGYSFPQCSVPPNDVIECVTKIAQACIKRDIIGYISITLITFMELNNKQCLWAIDIDIGYSNSLGMTEFILHSMNGKLDNLCSQIKVDIEESPVKKYVKQRKNIPKINSKKKIIYDQDRVVVFSSNLCHTNLRNIRYDVFFHMCKAQGIGYDSQRKIGTLFLLIDHEKRDKIGILTIDTSLENTINQFGKNLSIIHRELSSTSMQGETNFSNAIRDISEILNTGEENLNLAIASEDSKVGNIIRKSSKDSKTDLSLHPPSPSLRNGRMLNTTPV